MVVPHKGQGLRYSVSLCLRLVRNWKKNNKIQNAIHQKLLYTYQFFERNFRLNYIKQLKVQNIGDICSQMLAQIVIFKKIYPWINFFLKLRLRI